MLVLHQLSDSKSFPHDAGHCIYYNILILNWMKHTKLKLAKVQKSFEKKKPNKNRSC